MGKTIAPTAIFGILWLVFVNINSVPLNIINVILYVGMGAMTTIHLFKD